MYYVIEVNHKEIGDFADEIKNYCSDQDREMRSADSEVKSMLTNGWTGSDAVEFSKQWEGIDDRDSRTVTFRESLKNFSENLKACADIYKTAQEDVYDEANRLPKWIYW